MLEAVRDYRTEERGGPPDKCACPWGLGMEGEGRTRTLLFLLFLAVLAYLGNQLVTAYVGYVDLRETVRFVVQDIALHHQRGTDKGKEKILAKARELQMPLAERQVSITMDEDIVVAHVTWDQPIGVGQYTIAYPFEIEETYRILYR